MPGRSLFDSIAAELRGFFDPLRASLDDHAVDIMGALGWYWPTGVGLNAGALKDLLDDLSRLPDPTAPDADPLVYVQVLDAITGVLAALEDFDDLLPDPADLADEAAAQVRAVVDEGAEVGQRLLAYLLVHFLERRHPTILAALKALGVIEIRWHDFTDEHPAYREIGVNWSRLPQAVQAPSDLLAEVYGWGDPAFDAERVLEVLEAAAVGIGSPGARHRLDPELAARLYYAPEDVPDAIDAALIVGRRQLRIPLFEARDPETGYARFGLLVTGMPRRGDVDAGIRGLALVPYAGGEAGMAFDVSASMRVVFSGEFAGGFAITLLPPADVDVVSDLFGGSGVEASLGAQLVHSPADTIVLLGRRTGSRVELASITLGADLLVDGDGADIGVEGTLTKLALVLQGGEGDGFLASVLPADPMRLDFDVTAGVSVRDGFYVRGGAGLEIDIPVERELGPVIVHSVLIRPELDSGRIGLELGASLSGRVGPATIAIDGIGVRAALELPAQDRLPGLDDLSFGFSPPTGAGLAIDAQGIRGGGFLRFDPPDYAGVFAVAFEETLDLTVFALITTELPDGRSGFSMLLSILARFQPVQIGFGFAIQGVGGLIGVHRRMDEEALRVVFKDHSLDAILFPEDPIADAVRLLDAIDSIFPAQRDFHTFGLAADVIWGGSYNLVNFRVGVIIEVGDGTVRVAVVGQAEAVLPDPEAPILVLHLDLIGLLDFPDSSLAVDAELYDSYLRGMPLSGAMALRTNWRDEDADFALSIGGFYPGFRPPDGFPKLSPLLLRLDRSSARIELSGYMAITANTLQTGAHLQIEAGLAGAVEVSGHAGFDALIRFSPFSFETMLRAALAVRWKGASIGGIDMLLRLSGPNPYHAVGSVEVSMLFASVTVEFDRRFGDAVADTPPLVSPFDALHAELEKPRNLRFKLPDWTSSYVVLREDESVDNLLDPFGAIVFSQSAVPIHLSLERFGGGQPPADERRLEIQLEDADGVDEEYVQTPFSPAQFRDWSDRQKLAAPSFERMHAGKRWSPGLTVPGSAEDVELDYETIVWDHADADDLDDPVFRRDLPDRFAALAGRQRIAGRGAGTGYGRHRKFVAVAEPAFAVAGQAATDGEFHREDEGAENTTYAEAMDALSGSPDARVRDAAFVTPAAEDK